MRYLSECREFFQQFRRQYHNTGSVLPSSRSLARALVSELRKHARPARILEVGPGSGAVTGEILRLLRPDDRLDLVEINADFVALLRRRFAEEPPWRARREQARLIHASLQEVPGEGLYDYLISGLPLNNFPVALVGEIFDAYRRLLRPGGVLSYFEYILIRQLKMLFVSGPERERLRRLSRLLEGKIHAHQIREQWVFPNVPPAVARHFRFST
jgi:phosphatidylethanolamine/phosphatidyl-N-methylethanolamine N-methyltransferase